MDPPLHSHHTMEEIEAAGMANLSILLITKAMLDHQRDPKLSFIKASLPLTPLQALNSLSPQAAAFQEAASEEGASVLNAAVHEEVTSRVV